MTSARCPACGAALAADAPWCTLCYADLRAPAEQPAQPAQAAPTEEDHRPRHAAASVDLLDPALDQAVVTHADAVRGPAGWPCQACGTTVPLSEDACPHCGTGFLAGADPTPSVSLPAVGDVTKLSTGGRYGLMAGAFVVVTLVLLVVLAVVGHFV